MVFGYTHNFEIHTGHMCDQLREIKKWGKFKLHNNGYKFNYCRYLQITIRVVPDLTEVTNVTGMFSRVLSF